MKRYLLSALLLCSTASLAPAQGGPSPCPPSKPNCHPAPPLPQPKPVKPAH